MRILCLDPSGSYNEGSGTTGYAVFEDSSLVYFGVISAAQFESAEDYWLNVVDFVSDSLKYNLIVCESFKLFAHKAKQQSWSELETVQLIGAIRVEAKRNGIPIVFQEPMNKIRVSDEILVHEGVFEKKGNRYFCMGRQSIIHERDAIRHGIFYLRYGKK